MLARTVASGSIHRTASLGGLLNFPGIRHTSLDDMSNLFTQSGLFTSPRQTEYPPNGPDRVRWRLARSRQSVRESGCHNHI